MSFDAHRTTDEDRLWKRAGAGTALGMLGVAAIAMLLFQLGAPDQTLLVKVAVSLFLGFWCGPYFGLAGAAAYHGIRSEAEHAETPPIEAPDAEIEAPELAQAA